MNFEYGQELLMHWRFPTGCRSPLTFHATRASGFLDKWLEDGNVWTVGVGGQRDVVQTTAA
ncbi:hypothetical protein [Paraburkholderia sp. GAS334]|uniref:hypothetical protein n=1 Tax=Paraburkholderia sp. GAS334 TaxID=3035131 RepID=UPI003D253EDD